MPGDEEYDNAPLKIIFKIEDLDEISRDREVPKYRGDDKIGTKEFKFGKSKTENHLFPRRVSLWDSAYTEITYTAAP